MAACARSVGGDVAFLRELVEGIGQFSVERVDELAARSDRGIGWARTADEDDGRGEGVGAHSI